MKLLKKFLVIALFIGAQQMSAMNEQELAAYRRQVQLEDAAQQASKALHELSSYNHQIGTTLHLMRYNEQRAQTGDFKEQHKKDFLRLQGIVEDMQEERAKMCANLRNNVLKNNIFLQEPDTSVNISQGQGWVELHYNSKKMREDINHECNKKIEPIKPPIRDEWNY